VKGKHCVLTVVNPDIHNTNNTEISVRGSRVTNPRSLVLTAPDIHAHNTFESPRAVEPVDKPVNTALPFVYDFAPASVTRLEFDLE
jgi:alpha-N-arabinofuranosidase